jgi:hypothetical protein
VCGKQYYPDSAKFPLPEEQAMVLRRPARPVYMLRTSAVLYDGTLTATGYARRLPVEDRFSCLLPVGRADLVGPLRVDLARIKRPGNGRFLREPDGSSRREVDIP